MHSAFERWGKRGWENRKKLCKGARKFASERVDSTVPSSLPLPKWAGVAEFCPVSCWWFLRNTPNKAWNCKFDCWCVIYSLIFVALWPQFHLIFAMARIYLWLRTLWMIWAFGCGATQCRQRLSSTDSHKLPCVFSGEGGTSTND